MGFLGKRVLQLIAVLFAVSILCFFMLSMLPGNTADTICGGSCTAEGRAQIEADLGLNKPIPVRYVNWLSGVVKGDFGTSARTQQNVSEALSERLPVTLQLLVMSQIFSLGIAIPLAMISAQKQGGFFDRFSSASVFGLLSVPSFVAGLLLILLFAVNLKLFPASGHVTLKDNPFESIRSLVLPAISMGIGEIAIYMRLLRTDLITTLQEDYMMMAKSKGLPSRYLLLRHAFRPSTFSLITVIGLRMGGLIGGAIVIEKLFALNGIGTYLVEGIISRDYVPVQGAVIVIAAGYVLINFAVDLLYAVLDPRIRHAR